MAEGTADGRGGVTRVAVTGATGNVGTAVLRRLEAAEVEVVGLARRPPDPAPGAVRWVSADLTDDASDRDLLEAFEGVDAVVHLAWGFQPSHRPDRLRELGVGGTRRVLRAATRAGVPHLVHLSSVGAYSPKQDDVPVDESWPTDGIDTSAYSRHKVAAERLLDEHEAGAAAPRVARLRPGVIGQATAASALLRYGVPGYVPARALGWLPVLPLDRRLRIPVVHADDVADAVERVVRTSAAGAFNLASPPPVDPGILAAAFGARHVPVPAAVLRGAAAVSWRARLQQVDPGWLDLAMQVPLLDTGRAERELGWAPTRTSTDVIDEVVSAMTDARHGATPVLRPRTLRGRLSDAVRRGPMANRPRP